MQFLKTIVVSVFLGFYFLGITPLHFYVHQIEVEANEDEHHNSSEDCQYINLLNANQGSFLNSDSFYFQHEATPLLPFQKLVFSKENQLKNLHLYQLSTRGPPTLNLLATA